MYVRRELHPALCVKAVRTPTDWYIVCLLRAAVLISVTPVGHPSSSSADGLVVLLEPASELLGRGGPAAAVQGCRGTKMCSGVSVDNKRWGGREDVVSDHTHTPSARPV